MTGNELATEIYIGENGNWYIDNQDTGVHAQGEPGKSAYEIAQGLGFDGTESDWLNTLRGKAGATGAKGESGPKGDPGIPGTNGVTPHIGANGNWYVGETDTMIAATGPKGDKGDTGEKGETGSAGSSGADGRDGVPGATGATGFTRSSRSSGINRSDRFTGSSRSTGINRSPGSNGSHRPAGHDRSKGRYRSAGPQGAQGIQGPKGDAGPQGPQGIPGPVHIANNLDTADPDYALGASQGEVIGNLKNEVKTINSKLPVVKWGDRGGTVNPNTYVDFPITYGYTYKTIPAVTATLSNFTEWIPAYAKIQIFVLGATKTGATIRIMNGYESQAEPYVTWVAVGI